MSANADTAEKLTKAYIELQDMIAKPADVQTTKDPKDLKKVSRTSPRKRKLSSQYCYGDEEKVILPNANVLACSSGAPRGLFNLGATCYMSVILQAMICNPMMRNYFLTGRHDVTECTIENCVACSMAALFGEMLASDRVEGYGPVELLYKSWRNDEELEGVKQQDAHQYFQSFLNQLHLSSGKGSPKASKDCTCFYHQIFAGKLQSTVLCLTCRNVSETEDPIIDLSLDIRHQAKKRKMDSNAKANPDSPLELETCLKNFTASEKLGADAYKCRSDICRDTHQRARKHLTIKRLPPTMCITFKRYEKTHEKKEPIKLDTKVAFPLQLDMTPYTTRNFQRVRTYQQAQKQNQQRGNAADAAGEPPQQPPFDPYRTPLSARSLGWYDLAAVIVHIGATINTGHYICYCRRGDRWLKFDDNKVTLAGEKEVLAANPYLLFYVVRNLKEGPNGKEGVKEEEEEVERVESSGSDD
ncbi:hypothetical protein MMC25_002268 [Agyrium rufum]|nr:hypothetical protein [Agyrium rufum]